MRLDRAIDENGAPLLLAAAVVVPTRSGNPAHDVASGKFGSAGRKKNESSEDSASQAQRDPATGSEQRRRDAVVDAARTLDDLTPAGVEAFVRRRWSGRRALTQAEIGAFAADARRQRLHDVVDAVDFRIRKAVYGRAGSRHPHLVIPRGLQRKSLAGLDHDEVVMLFSRLHERGWNDQQIKRHGIRRLDSKDRRLQGLLR